MVTWRVEVDGEACMGSGMCAALLPDVFELSGSYARVRVDEVGENETVLDAADSCPAMAITVSTGSEVVGPRP